ncbi:hypothetical protein FAZ95_33985 [Trinickia violacea]|uniref:DUF3757 domain-containing protein n=1 Tax=Trinickia violacea TaxID=2571746 RepID=A0A4P8J1X7_9BURK|nr:hypothetical protein [Trinickia violacea]QCP54003.1 hypothetical protein FAZ95_33985 [Trinickia violacea]
MPNLNRYVRAVSLLCVIAVGHAEATTLTGIFSGQGRPCWGRLRLTSKTIEWTTPYSACKATAYDVVEQDLKSKAPIASYRLKQRNSACRFPYISVKFDPAYPDYWQLVGYASKKAFEQRKEDGPEQQDQRLECSARKLE